MALTALLFALAALCVALLALLAALDARDFWRAVLELDDDTASDYPRPYTPPNLLRGRPWRTR